MSWPRAPHRRQRRRRYFSPAIHHPWPPPRAREKGKEEGDPGHVPAAPLLTVAGEPPTRARPRSGRRRSVYREKEGGETKLGFRGRCAGRWFLFRRNRRAAVGCNPTAGGGRTGSPSVGRDGPCASELGRWPARVQQQ